MAASDSIDWSDPGGSADRSDPNATSLSHQAATVGLQRFGFADLQQRGIPFCPGPTPALQKAPGHSRAQHEPHSNQSAGRTDRPPPEMNPGMDGPPQTLKLLVVSDVRRRNGLLSSKLAK